MNSEHIQVRAYQRLVRRFLAEGQLDNARQIAMKAVQQHPLNALAWLLLSDVTARPHDRILALRKALQLNPDLHDARCLLAELEAQGPRVSTGLLPQL